ncbi:swr1 complex component [Bachmanniomyces sp. S44760]|nr:swr1 complex component [Bachmanniomyces sp. S44760]
MQSLHDSFETKQPITNGLLDHGQHDQPVDQSRRAPETNAAPEHEFQVERDYYGDYGNGPPPKKRKLGDPAVRSPSVSRPISPPWKKVIVEGPTSFVEGGRRKSSRTNHVPLDLQPQADKRQTRAAMHQTQVTKNKYGGTKVHRTSPLVTSSTQTYSNGKRYSSSGGKASSSLMNSRPPANPQLQIGQSPKTCNVNVRSHSPSMPTEPRSHKRNAPPESFQSSPRSPQQRRGPGRPRKVSLMERLAAPIVESNRWDDGEHQNDTEEDDEAESEELPVDPNFRHQRLKFKVCMPTITIQHPANVLPRKKFSSFEKWFSTGDALDTQECADLRIHDPLKEARIRRRLLDETQPGGILTERRCKAFRPEKAELPPKQHGHYDHLVAHAIYFRKLMIKEEAKHKANAKKYATLCAAEVERKRPKSAAELRILTLQDIESQARLARKQFHKDLMRMWNSIRTEVNERRRVAWEQEQEVRGREALNRVLEQSTTLLDRRRRRSSAGSSEPGDATSDGGCISDVETHSPLFSEDERNMSESQSEGEMGADGDIMDDDEGLTVEELRRKYIDVPCANLDRPLDVGQKGNHTEPTWGGLPQHALAHVPNPIPITRRSPLAVEAKPSQESIDRFNDDIRSQNASTEKDGEQQRFQLVDDSDESVDMDDDMGSSDEAFEEEDHGSDGNSDDLPDPHSLLGFFTKKDLQATDGDTELTKEKTLVDNAEPFDSEVEEVSLIPDATQVQTPSASNSEEPSSEFCKEVPRTARDDLKGSLRLSTKPEQLTQVINSEVVDNFVDKLQAGEQGQAVLHTPGVSLPTTPVSSQNLKTKVPFLLRGTLREYQHFGLDWLAGLYANGTSGILADEMGLGKTIQTISLLAHIAEEHKIWGPHLIIVPTSVMLNWEMEFKKFLPGFKILTYYGTQEERKQKRKGWLDDDKWNVCITSYQLILADQQTFKRRAWHYLVLDEAHNIKNFRSQRWQTLLTFRSRARLLLTGTPLQNNLTELWSLMFFLMPSDSTETGIAGFADLQSFSQWFKKPVDQILEHGRDTMDDEAKELVRRLHGVLRPYLLRRLKADVEKQMPAKYEHVVFCKLSKRQRHLYDGFMSRSQTRETLARGNYLSIINCLMQLRKVCNHPDLFETRQTVTSYALPQSAAADFEIKEFLVRRRLLSDDALEKVNLNVINLLPGANGPMSALETIQTCRLGALGRLRQLVTQQYGRILPNMQFDGTSINTTLSYLENSARTVRLGGLRHHAYITSLRSQRRPLYSYGLMERLRFNLKTLPYPPSPDKKAQLAEWFSFKSSIMEDMVLSLSRRSASLQTTIEKFACVTPAAVAPGITSLALTRPIIEAIQDAQQLCPADAFHEARMRLSIAFPDKRLLQYDCGKLQRLAILLRTLQAGGHRALIFTQMTKVLDILEQFLNIHGHRYLRLDGATRIEQRQILTDRFNNDKRILAFILSTRSGGLGINLTGADTVIFYDLDWNPAMDKQCQDRCHRIGQTRDVHIYRFVSEYTIEANILRKANQKRMLDDVIIQEGEFTTDHFNTSTTDDERRSKLLDDDRAHEDGDAEASAAMDRVFGRGGTRAGKVSEEILEHAEDKEDVAAAKIAEREIIQEDKADFAEDKAANSGGGGSDTPAAARNPDNLILVRPNEIGAPGCEAIEFHATADLRPAVKNYTGLHSPGRLAPVEHDRLEVADDMGQRVEAGVEDWMFAFVERELRDIPYVPEGERNRIRQKAVRKGEEHRVRRPR